MNMEQNSKDDEHFSPPAIKFSSLKATTMDSYLCALPMMVCEFTSMNTSIFFKSAHTCWYAHTHKC